MVFTHSDAQRLQGGVDGILVPFEPQMQDPESGCKVTEERGQTNKGPQHSLAGNEPSFNVATALVPISVCGDCCQTAAACQCPVAATHWPGPSKGEPDKPDSVGVGSNNDSDDEDEIPLISCRRHEARSSTTHATTATDAGADNRGTGGDMLDAAVDADHGAPVEGDTDAASDIPSEPLRGRASSLEPTVLVLSAYEVKAGVEDASLMPLDQMEVQAGEGLAVTKTTKGPSELKRDANLTEEACGGVGNMLDLSPPSPPTELQAPLDSRRAHFDANPRAAAGPTEQDSNIKRAIEMAVGQKRPRPTEDEPVWLQGQGHEHTGTATSVLAGTENGNNLPGLVAQLVSLFPNIAARQLSMKDQIEELERAVFGETKGPRRLLARACELRAELY